MRTPDPGDEWWNRDVDDLPPECEDCGEPTSGFVFSDAHGHNKVFLCATCLARYESREPSDERIMNGPGVEGGIRYDTAVRKIR